MKLPWIKPTDKLPTESGKYLVTLGILFPHLDFVYFSNDLHKWDEYEFKKGEKGFYINDSEWGIIKLDNNNIKAWCPIQFEIYDENDENTIDNYDDVIYNVSMSKRAR